MAATTLRRWTIPLSQLLNHMIVSSNHSPNHMMMHRMSVHGGNVLTIAVMSIATGAIVSRYVL